MHALRTPPLASHPMVDPDPVDVFVRRHQTALWRFLRLCGGSGKEAEEIAQEALLIALRRMQRLRRALPATRIVDTSGTEAR